MNIKDDYLPFSQRTGLSPVPPQLKLGEVSPDLRRLLEYYIILEIDRESRFGVDRSYFPDEWCRVAMDLHVVFLGHNVGTFQNEPWTLRKIIERNTAQAPLGKLFDLVEFFVRHPACSDELKADITGAFVKSRSAYRVVDSQIVAIGTLEQATAFEEAIETAEKKGAFPARQHLVASARELRDGNWAGSVRESIHAVEAMAVKLAPGTTTLGDALAALEKRGHLHGSLKKAFSQLYGYSSNEEGVRHALVFEKEANVDEADALFMLGACASFVSYLLARKPATSE